MIRETASGIFPIDFSQLPRAICWRRRASGGQIMMIRRAHHQERTDRAIFCSRFVSRDDHPRNSLLPACSDLTLASLTFLSRSRAKGSLASSLLRLLGRYNRVVAIILR